MNERTRSPVSSGNFLDSIGPELFDSELLAAVPVTWARRNAALPAREPRGRAILVLPGPEALALLPAAALAAGCDFAPAFAPREKILAAIEAAYFAARPTAPTAAAARPTAATAAAPSSGNAQPAARETPAAGEDLLVRRDEPAARALNETILSAVRQGASDIHLEPDGLGGAHVRFRLAGRLYSQPDATIPAPLGIQVVSRLKVMGGMDIAEHRLPQDGMAQVRAGTRAVDLRVSTIPTADGERAVLRLLNREDSLLPLTSLGMDGAALAGFQSLLERPNGIVAVCGPTGSGKTTTLYAALGSLDFARRNVMTIEDPVECRINGISQTQVRPGIGLTFASGLRSLLRQDPDVVLVGETRDPETAEIAVRASLTGHLVLTTLHTNDAPSAVMRLVDLGVEPYLLSSCLRGVLAQRLVRKVCRRCGVKVPAGDASLGAAQAALARAAGCDSVMRANSAGCGECLEGHRGRTGIFELLLCDDNVAEAIHAGRLSTGELRAAAGNGFLPMAADAARKLRSLETTAAEILSAIGGGAETALDWSQR